MHNITLRSALPKSLYDGEESSYSLSQVLRALTKRGKETEKRVKRSQWQHCTWRGAVTLAWQSCSIVYLVLLKTRRVFYRGLQSI